MNAFSAFGQEHSRRPRAPKAPVTVTEKLQAEDAARMKNYNRLVREEREHAYSLPGGEAALKLVGWAKRMTLEDGDELIARVKALPPLKEATRFRLLADLDRAIVSLRLRNGLAPLDDPLPGEEDDVFRIVKRELEQ